MIGMASMQHCLVDMELRFSELLVGHSGYTIKFIFII